MAEKHDAVYEKSVGAVVFKRLKGIPRYLLLRHRADYWNFPKGLAEAGESEQETARREIAEETGLIDIEFLPGFRGRDHYVFRRASPTPGHKGVLTVKDVFFYLAAVRRGRVKTSWEHEGYAWLPYEKARGLLKYAGAKKILVKAREFLETRTRLQKKTRME